MTEAFHSHQGGDKGFGPAAGPAAPDLLSESFVAAHYTVREADSAWRLGEADAALIADLAQGFATAVAATGAVDAASITKLVRRGADSGGGGPRRYLGATALALGGRGHRHGAADCAHKKAVAGKRRPYRKGR